MSRTLVVIDPVRDRSLRRALAKRSGNWVPSTAKKGTYNRAIISVKETDGRSIVLHATKGYRNYHV